MKWHIKAMGIVLVSSLPMTVSAQEAGFYLGGALGYANLDEDSSNLQSDLVNEGLTGTVTMDDEDMGWKLFGGYMFNHYFSVEAGYVDLGKAKADFSITVPAVVGGSADVALDGFNISGIVSYPVSEQFHVFAKGGAFLWDAKLQATIDGFGSFDEDDDGTDFLFGFGVRYGFNENVSVRVEWERFASISEDGNDVDLMSVGIQYHF